MYHSQTHALLQILDKSELTALGKYLQSPFATAKKFIYPLFKILKSQKPGAGKKVEALFARVFPGEAFDQDKWNRALSDLNACILEFLAITHLSADPVLKQQTYIDAFHGRENEKLFLRFTDPVLNNPPGSEAGEMPDSWYLRFITLQRVASYPLTDRMKKIQDPFLDDLEQSLDTYYFISRLQLACNRVSRQHYQRTAHDQAFYSQLLDQSAPLARTGKSALLQLYHALLVLLVRPDASFDSFFDMLCTQAPRLFREEQEYLVRLSINYCIRRNREGHEEALGWYQRLIDWAAAHHLYTDTPMSEETFLNMGILFAKTHDAGGFNSHLEKAGNTLLSDRSEDAVALLKAYWHFYQGEFGPAGTLLNREVDTRHARFALLYHSLNVRNAYEEWQLQSTDRDELERALHNFKDFLHRKEAFFSDALVNSYLALIAFVRKLIQAKIKGVADQAMLLRELNEAQPATADWLRAKIGDLHQG